MSEPAELSAIEGSPRNSDTSAYALKLTAASVIAGVAGIVLLFVVARSVSADDYSQFMLYWSLLFSLFGLLTGVQHEANRTVSYAQIGPGQRKLSLKAVRVLPASLAIGAGVALVTLAIGIPLAVSSAAGEPESMWSSVAIVFTLALAAVLYAGQAGMSGAAAGQAKWGVLSALIGYDAIVRSAAVLVVVWISSSLLGIEVASAAGVFTWILMLLLSPQAREAAKSTGDVRSGRFVRNALLTMVSAAATTILMVGFPILLRLTTPQDVYLGLGGLLLAVSLTRAPIMMPLLAFQSVALRFFVSTASQARKAHVLIPVIVLLSVGIVGGALAYFLGPWVLALFNPAFLISPWTLALLTFDAAVFAILTLTGTANVSLNKHVGFALGWLVATLGSFAVLLLDMDPETRTVVALLVGPVLGIGIHLVSLWRPAQQRKGRSPKLT